MNDKKKIIILVIGLIISALIISGATFAWFTWSSSSNDQTNVTFNAPNGNNQLKAILDGDNTTFNGMYPAETCAGNGAKMATVKLYYLNNSGSDAIINATLSLNSISSIHSGTIDQSKVKWALSTTTGDNCTSGIIASGNLGGVSIGGTIYNGDLDTGKIPTGTAFANPNKTLYLYFYIDHTYEMYTVSDIGVTDPLQDLSLKVVWDGTITNDLFYKDPSGANAPELTSGMVPVKLNENGTVVTTVDPVSSRGWYDYSQQKWANAVLVDSSVRSNYIDSSGNIIPNVNVDTSKILAYYVWIPRYKYTFADNSTQNPYPEQSIDIVFEDKNAPRATGGANGPDDYYTHPAFTWNFTGDTLDESTPNLGGIWVGKFELSHTSLTTSSMNCTSTSCTNANYIRILPNKNSLRSNTVASFFYGIRSMQQSGNSFGLPTDITTADSHMMKNREWGAVAYLAHSKYGLGNQEVRINSYTTYKIGCGGSSTDPSSIESTCYDPYGKTITTSPSTTGDISTYPQSTTGNITGVFDTSGGVTEYVMGNNKGINSSASFKSLPVLKYYDKYTVTSINSCTFAECGGHALNETANWHSDGAYFANSDSPWFNRGGGPGGGRYAGPFCLSNTNGTNFFDVGTRSVVVVA